MAKQDCAVIELGAVVIDHADVFGHPITDFHSPSNAEVYLYKLLDEHSRTTAGLRSNIEQVEKKLSQA